MGTSGRRARRTGMAGSGARPPVGVGTASEDTDVSPRECAEYIASILEGLRQSAHQANLPFLAYLISVALEEANSEKQKPK